MKTTTRKSLCLLLLALLLFFTSACSSKGNRDSYLNIPCDSTSLDFVHYEDSIAVLKLMDEFGIPRRSKLRDTMAQYYGFGLNYLLARVRNPNINRKIYDSIARTSLPYENTMFKKTIYYYLEVWEFFLYANADAVFLGKLIDINNIYDTITCKKYNQDYIVEVNEMLYNNGNIVFGDYIKLKDSYGYSGACANDRSGYKTISIVMDGVDINNIGSTYIYIIDLSGSSRMFALEKFFKNIPQKYKDNFCNSQFIIHAMPLYYEKLGGGIKNNDSKSIKQFLKLIHTP